MQFTEEQMMLKQMVDRLALEQVAPLAAVIDREERFGHENWEKMGELGLFGTGIPEEYGGSGGGIVEECIIGESLARYCVSTASCWASHVDLCMANLNRNGTDEQKRRYLPDLCTGKKIGGLAMTEPGAGSDVLGMSMRAVRDGDGFVLNGTKTFITNGPIGDVFVVYAKTSSGAKAKNITAFVIERGMPGFSTGKEFEKLGWHGSPTGELVFEDCRVPMENVLGEVDGGAYVLLSGLNSERLVVAAECLGLARACLEESVVYAKQREQFGRRIADFQMVQEKLARMAVKVEAAKALIWDLAFEMEQKGPHGLVMESAAAKLYASEVSVENALTATQIFGGYGYTREFPVERYLRDSRIMTIGAGTSEIMCHIIFRQLDKRYGAGG
ncbi:MAG: acyl-CoA dehydrogenase family protein [Deltaproteobacteria bacterium]|nr:acyl-CoA dehydrogenase family protein [Deltaproteobacteria bacterium]MBW2283906.1 acyl-CoA dehydrogenase family protein [Deltaproteobacteria bacterium]